MLASNDVEILAMYFSLCHSFLLCLKELTSSSIHSIPEIFENPCCFVQTHVYCCPSEFSHAIIKYRGVMGWRDWRLSKCLM